MKIGDKVRLRNPIIGHVYSDYITHKNDEGIISHIYIPDTPSGFKYQIKWPDGSTSSVAEQNILPTKFRIGDVVKVDDKLITITDYSQSFNEDTILVSRKQLF